MLLPEAKRRDEIKFLFAKSLPYNRRLILIAVFLLAGFALQILVNIWAGAVCLLTATLLSLVRGYSNIPDQPSGSKAWGPAERKQLEEILRIGQVSRRWDQSAIDITCGQGVITLLFIAGAVTLIAYQLALNNDEWLMTVWILDAVVLIAPHWVTGVRRVLTNAALLVKVRLFLTVWDHWETIKAEGETMAPQIEVHKRKSGAMPVDAKMILRSSVAPPSFLGLQMQIAINSVQGSDYPYFYCVLVAKHEFGLREKFESVDTSTLPSKGDLVSEESRDEEVDVIVVRWRTTKTGGYHTKPAMAIKIFDYAWSLMHQILEMDAGRSGGHEKKTGARR